MAAVTNNTETQDMITSLANMRSGQTRRCSSWDTGGRNSDWVTTQPGETRVLADIRGSGMITHIWMANHDNFRETLIRITWDDAERPSVEVPIGDFFCLGHGIVNSFQSLLFTASTEHNNRFNKPCALNCYVPMPFKERALVELVNQGTRAQRNWYYIDYESVTPDAVANTTGYFHAEFRRANPFGGWGHEIRVNTPEADIVNQGKLAWDNNYVILDTKGRGHYVGCNLSVTNFLGTWWGEGDDMIWIDGFKWPPDIHGTGSEDYLGHAWGMQDHAYLRNGSSIHERNTSGYQTSYVLHIENPIRFEKEIKVTIEHGHGNHLANEMSSVAYWYADRPTSIVAPPPVAKRLAVLRDSQNNWLYDKGNQCPGKKIALNAEMKKNKKHWAKKNP
jgi:hypothetical protein